MADRADWEQATRRQRQLAIAADAELCRRHPGQHHPPLRSAEPPPLTSDEPAPSTDDDIRRTGELIAELTAQRREFARQFAERTRQPLSVSNSADFGPAFPAWTGEARDAILQPPKPQIKPSPRILERVPGHDLDLEAAD